MLSFKGYIAEMAEQQSQQGFQYEKNAAAVLKKFGIVPENFTPAGAGSDIPDLYIIRPGYNKTGCELKITSASAGSLVMKYDEGRKQWKIGSDDETNDEKLFIMELAQQVGIIDTIKREWTNVPYKFTKNKSLLDEIEGLDKKEKYKAELSRFKDIKGKIPATKIEEYYNKKKTYYVNIGTDGFFLLGSTNPLKLSNAIPKFGSAANATYRARVQYKGSGNYQFTFEMQFSIPSGKRSPFNLAPIINKNNVNIDMNALKLDWFLNV